MRFLVNWGFRRGEWRVSDNFGDEWRIFFTPLDEQRPDGNRTDWESRSRIELLVFQGFAPGGASDDRIASVLLQIYDALTNSTLSSQLPRPTSDPRRLLVDYDRTLRYELVNAFVADEIRIEQVVRAPWPFLDLPDPPVAPHLDVPAPEVATWIGLLLVDQTGQPVPNRAYRVIFPDGTSQDGTLDNAGAAMLSGTVPGACQVYCPYADSHARLAYEVQQGDHLSGVAQNFGYDDYTLVWNDSGNADLQNQRSDPHVLVPGDSLAVPAYTAQAISKPTGATHTFTIVRSPLKLRLTLLDLAANPMANVSVTIDGAELTTDGNGLVEVPLDKTESSAQVALPNSSFALSVGALNPSDDATDAGYKARLFNLGFLWDPTVDDTDDEMVIALQDFQAQYQLSVTGQLDDATKAQLAQTHGS